MSQEYIVIQGARENNLKNVSLRIPKRCITIFTGVSGSGKSSIVFDTLAAEARRQLNETFSTFVHNFLPRYSQPDADAIENLSMAIVVDQKRMGGGPARRWAQSPTSIPCCVCCTRALASRLWAITMSFRSMIRKACVRSATAWVAR